MENIVPYLVYQQQNTSAPLQSLIFFILLKAFVENQSLIN